MHVPEGFRRLAVGGEFYRVAGVYHFTPLGPSGTVTVTVEEELGSGLFIASSDKHPKFPGAAGPYWPSGAHGPSAEDALDRLLTSWGIVLREHAPESIEWLGDGESK